MSRHVEIATAIYARRDGAQDHPWAPTFPALLVVSRWCLALLARDLMLHSLHTTDPREAPRSMYGVPLVVDGRRDGRDYWTLYTNAGLEHDAAAIERTLGVRLTDFGVRLERPMTPDQARPRPIHLR